MNLFIPIFWIGHQKGNKNMESYRTLGTCSRQILYEVDENNILTDVKFLGGCPGGLQALARFTKGKPICDVIKICEGIKCKNDTSCPDQLAKALKSYIKSQEEPTQTVKRGHPQVLKLNIQVVNVKLQKKGE